MKILLSAAAAAMALAASVAHAEGPEPMTIMDVPDLWLWASVTPLLKGAPHQDVPPDFVPDPINIRLYVRDAVRASGKSCDAVKEILVVPSDSETHVLQIVCTQATYRLTMAHERQPVLE